MSFLKKYIKMHIKGLYILYRIILIKTDKNTFALLFNFRSFLIRSGARVTWEGSKFVVTDKAVPGFSSQIRHQETCNNFYQFGISARAEGLENVYFLKQINFKSGDIFLDCGANVGDLKIWFDLNNINITYVGFEPSPVEFKCLQANIKPNQAHNVGLWDKEGELTFYVSSQGGDSSLIEPKSYDQTVISKVMRLESFVEKRVKCLKLEAEGAEPEILEGLGEKLGLVEFISADLGYERGVDSESTLVPVTNFLLARGFELVDVSHGRICALYRNTKVS